MADEPTSAEQPGAEAAPRPPADAPAAPAEVSGASDGEASKPAAGEPPDPEGLIGAFGGGTDGGDVDWAEQAALSAVPPSRGTFWETAERLDRPRGQCPDGVDLQLLRSEVRGCRGVVVLGDVHFQAQWVAEHLAQSGSAKEVRRRTTGDQNSRFSDLLKQLGDFPEGHLVLDYWGPGVQRLFLSLDSLSEAVSRQAAVGGPCQLLIWTQARLLDDLVQAGRAWPENIKLVSIGASRRESPAKSDGPRDEAFFRDLFGGNLASLADVVRSQERCIEQALARLVILFDPLPSSDVDDLMAAVLADERIELSMGGDGERQSLPAGDLWRRGKDLALRNAGLSRLTGNDQVFIAFPSKEVADAAAGAAWGDPAAMLDLFADASRAHVLFGSDSERQRAEIFAGYRRGAYALASRAPRLFSERWLGIVREDYRAWVARVAPDVALGDEPIGVLLAGLASQPPRSRRMLWTHFARRMGFLCRDLLNAAPDAVEGLLEHLMRSRAQPVLWLLLEEIRTQDIDRYQRWVRRLIAESGDFRHALTDALGRKVVHDPDAAVAILGLFAGWMPAPGQAPTSTLETAAVELPFLVLAEAYRCHERSSGEISFSLGEILRLPIPGAAPGEESTTQAYFEASLMLKSAEPPASPTRSLPLGCGAPYRVALAFLQMVVVTPATERAALLDLAGSIKSRLTPACRSAVNDQLRRMSEWFFAIKARLRFDDLGRRERDFLTERGNLCQKLVRA